MPTVGSFGWWVPEQGTLQPALELVKLFGDIGVSVASAEMAGRVHEVLVVSACAGTGAYGMVVGSTTLPDWSVMSFAPYGRVVGVLPVQRPDMRLTIWARHTFNPRGLTTIVDSPSSLGFTTYEFRAVINPGSLTWGTSVWNIRGADIGEDLQAHYRFVASLAPGNYDLEFQVRALTEPQTSSAWGCYLNQGMLACAMECWS